MYLLDTNIILEFLLDQKKADEVERFLHVTSPELLYLSEFTLYSLGIVLLRHKRYEAFKHSVEDLLVTGGIRLLRLGVEDMRDVTQVAQRFNLDFDDAYQYVAAEQYKLTLVSFDSDFDRTERGRRTPAEILGSMT